ncbi:MAG: hypothetical protein K2M82_04990 [Lachnospiraceae bacterium]|nr:hypothetical protein [Lachnospiraceae bacterium]
MKSFNKNIIAVLIMATVLTGCGNSPEHPQGIPVPTGIPMTTAQTSATVATTVAETTETTTSAETTTTVATTIPIEDRKPKVNDFVMKYYGDGIEEIFDYCFVPKEATEVSDDINLGLITVDGKEFDIVNLVDAYGEEEIRNIFGEQAGLYTTEQLIKDGVFDDVYIAFKASPLGEVFIFGEDKNVEEIEVNQEKHGIAKSKGAYDFITVEYVNNWFRGLHSKCMAMNSSSTVEQITVNGEVKTFVEKSPDTQFTENSDKLITYTDKNIVIGDGTTYGDLVTIFGAEPIYVDSDAGTGHICTYRNSTVTVGFVREHPRTNPALKNKNFRDLTQEEINSLRIVAVYQWLND